MDDMVLIPGGSFQMGSNDHYPEEAPAHMAEVASFRIDRAPVTNAAFAAFVEATGYVTGAETSPDPAEYPGLLPEMSQPASLVFDPPAKPVSMADPYQWWAMRRGAHWRCPYGPGTGIADKLDHPVVHIAYRDALAFAAWAGKTLPTECQWEYAARGGSGESPYAWGQELEPEGRLMANYWHGDFPWRNSLADGFARTSPVGSFAPNGFGLVDMIGNVWEWTSDLFTPHHGVRASQGCCAPRRNGTPERVLKGGSHLCAPNYCQRYRPAARYGQTEDTAASHVGFRCVAAV